MRLTPGSNADAIVARFPGDPYVGFHADRFAFALELVARHSPHPRSCLDVGPGPFTLLLAEQTRSPVDTLGFQPDGPSSGGGRHVQFDINDLRTPGKRPELRKYDLITFGEVLEHLYVAPQLVLSWLHDLLTPSGTLLVQTPNAAAFGRRVRLALGRNPYDLINTDPMHPRHFREYTARELVAFAGEARLDVVELIMGSYFDHRYESNPRTANRGKLIGTAQNALYRAFPPSLRTGMTAVLRPTA